MTAKSCLICVNFNVENYPSCKKLNQPMDDGECCKNEDRYYNYQNIAYACPWYDDEVINEKFIRWE